MKADFYLRRSKMKTLSVGMIMLLCVVAFVNAQEQATEQPVEQVASEPIGLDVGIDFYSKYIFRGQNLVDDWVMQPYASMGIEDFTLGVWGNVDMTNENDEEWNFTEVDYTLDYSNRLTDGIGYSLGYIYYAFPQGSNDTYEFYGGLTFDTCPMDPSITWYYDADEANGSYVAFAIGHSIELGDAPFGIDLGLNVGWADSSYNEYYWGVDDNGFNDLTVSVGLPMQIGGWSLTPSVNYAYLLDSDIQDSDRYDSSNDQVYAGISLGTSF
jgi:hypothetical protein